MGDFGKELGALVVRKVALAAEDALFVDGGAGGGEDHRGLVVGFDIEIVAPFEVVFYEGGCKAKIGTKTGFNGVGFEGEGNGVEGVVLNAERMNFDVAELESFSRGKNLEARGLSEDLYDRFCSVAVGKDRDLVFASECGKPFDMVGMFMGNENRVDGG
jgi:hypothetical protein